MKELKDLRRRIEDKRLTAESEKSITINPLAKVRKEGEIFAYTKVLLEINKIIED